MITKQWFDFLHLECQSPSLVCLVLCLHTERAFAFKLTCSPVQRGHQVLDHPIRITDKTMSCVQTPVHLNKGIDQFVLYLHELIKK